MKRLVLLTIAITLLSFSNYTQTTSEDAIGCATPESKSLNFLVGEWNVHSRFRLNRAADSWESTEAVSKITHLFKDCVYQEILTGARNGRPHQVTGLYSFSNISNKLQWVGGHSEHGVLSLYEGNFADGELILANEAIIRENKIYFRIVIRKTENGFSVRSERSSDKKSWDAGWFLEYTRKTLDSKTVNSRPEIDDKL